MTRLLDGIMPNMIAHEGLWRGTYRHVDVDGTLIETHQAEVRCEFPDTGPYGYLQHNHFNWEDGRDYRATLEGVLRDGRLWFDNDRFSGSAWESDHGLILLNLDRKDEPGANFYELICMGADVKHRARTWHWFRDGRLFKRTLCDEIRVQA